MNSANKNITLSQPSLARATTCSRLQSSSDSESGIAEGGMRLSGEYKKSLPGTPLVSIITVVFNGQETIERCIQSVINQSYKNIEFVIVDGDSTDGTVSILEKFSQSLDYFISQPDEGIYDAMNKGLALLSGDFVLILNSDDWYEKTAVEELVTQAVHSNADVVHADAYKVNGSGHVYGRLNGWLHDGLYTHRMPIRHETMLVKKSIYQKFGHYDQSYRIIADYEFLIRLHLGGCSFSHIPRALLFFSMSGVSNTEKAQVMLERKRLFKALFPFLEDVDLSLMGEGLSNAQRFNLIAKYQGKSELFARSLACNITNSSTLLANWLNVLGRMPVKPVLVIVQKIRHVLGWLRYAIGRYFM
jgi:glycosyltransferase involved in cell wall biosynthesis